jgi:DegV family protein with EDD domain
VIDSKNLSGGIGLLALKASELRDAGRSALEIEGVILKMIPRIRTSFVIDTMDYLYKGGRCSGLQAFTGSVLKIHPVIEVDSAGTLGVKAKFRGGRQKSLRYLLDDFKLNIESIDPGRIFITHVMCREDAEIIRDEIRAMITSEEIHITEAGSVIASHCGPGTIGILYCTKS